VKLSELIASAELRDGSARVQVGDDWMQGRSAFGGVQAAIALAAMRTLVPADMPLRTLQMTFIAPVAGDVVAQARVLRAGKNTVHVAAHLGEGDARLADLTCIFGSARESIVVHDMPRADPGKTPRSTLPFVRGVTPSFMQQFDVALIDGALPFSNSRVARSSYRLGLRDTGPAGEAHLLAFADFMPPVALSWMPNVVPGSSLTWMLEVLDADFAGEGLAGWRVDAEMMAARDGYTSQSTTIFAPSGKAVALSRQSMVVFG